MCFSVPMMFELIPFDCSLMVMLAEVTASIAQLVERPLFEREVVGSNPAAAPYQRCKKWY